MLQKKVSTHDMQERKIFITVSDYNSHQNVLEFRSKVYCTFLVFQSIGSQEECAILREGVPYVKIYRHDPKHLCPKLNGYGHNGQRSLKL
jgi:hypothetical protein